MKVAIHADPIGEPKAPKEPDDWEKQNMLDTIVKAHGIINDPKKMKHVTKLAKAQGGAFKSIDDIKAYSQAKYGPKPQGVAQLKQPQQAAQGKAPPADQDDDQGEGGTY